MLTAVGKVLKPFGVTGEAVVMPLTPDPERFQGLKKVLIDINGRMSELEISGVRFSGNKLVLRFKNYTDCEQVNKLRNQLLLIHDHDRIDPGPGNYFIHELTGCTVLMGGEKIGDVSEIFEPDGPNPLLRIDTGSDHFHIPFLKRFIARVDVANSVIELDEAARELVNILT
ncbi:MAG: ribosome maturation factor RimM [Candidatus Wallbacteria bacterium]|nr:ribosome maturation factor RimM [Candidatus Wallbacteria bacterium]